VGLNRLIEPRVNRGFHSAWRFVTGLTCSRWTPAFWRDDVLGLDSAVDHDEGSLESYGLARTARSRSIGHGSMLPVGDDQAVFLDLHLASADERRWRRSEVFKAELLSRLRMIRIGAVVQRPPRIGIDRSGHVLITLRTVRNTRPADHRPRPRPPMFPHTAPPRRCSRRELALVPTWRTLHNYPPVIEQRNSGLTPPPPPFFFF